MSFYPVGDDLFVVNDKRGFFEAARSFAENHGDDYTFEYEEYPRIRAVVDNEWTDDWQMPKFPFAVVFALRTSKGVNWLPEVDIVRTFDMQEVFRMFNSLIEAGGNVGE